MAKWVCNICGYIYDPEVGDPDNGVAAGTAWKMYRKTGFARSAVLAKTSSANNKKIKTGFVLLIKYGACFVFRIN